MGTVVHIAGMGTGLEKQHEGMDGLGNWMCGNGAGMGTNVRGAGGCKVATPTHTKL